MRALISAILLSWPVTSDAAGPRKPAAPPNGGASTPSVPRISLPILPAQTLNSPATPPSPSGGQPLRLSRDAARDEAAATLAAAGEILLERARALSQDADRESVLLLAHGPEDDAENRRWLARMESATAPMRGRGFRAVSVETLREDWPDERRRAEARIRAFVAEAAKNNGRAIVIPYRLFGFGPYRRRRKSDRHRERTPSQRRQNPAESPKKMAALTKRTANYDRGKRPLYVKSWGDRGDLNPRPQRSQRCALTS